MKVFLICVAMCLVASASTHEDRISHCEDSLIVKLDNLNRTQQRDIKFAQMREFLWRHWSHKKCGDLFLTATSLEGKTSRSRYSVELISPSAVVLKVKIVRNRGDYPEQLIPLESEYEADIVERVSSDNPYATGAIDKIKILSDDSIVAPSNYWLRFKTKKRNEVIYF